MIINASSGFNKKILQHAFLSIYIPVFTRYDLSGKVWGMVPSRNKILKKMRYDRQRDFVLLHNFIYAFDGGVRRTIWVFPKPLSWIICRLCSAQYCHPFIVHYTRIQASGTYSMKYKT
jgi:hypothetical protein